LSPKDESGLDFEALNAAALRIHRSGRTLERLLDAVAAEAKSLLRADDALVWTLDPAWDDLRGRRSPGEDEFRFPLGAGLTGRAAKTRKPFRTPNAPEEAGYDAEVDSPPSGDAEALMLVPLIDEADTLVGVLAAFAEGGRIFDGHDERTAKLIADHAAVALSGRSARERERRLLLDLTAALADAVDRRSPWTLDHSYRVREYCKKLGRAAELDADSQLALELAALLHGVGRGEIPVGAETEPAPGDKGARMKTHVVFAEAILRGVEFPPALAEVPGAVLHCLRGAAGTRGAKGGKAKAPSPLARMLLIADSYDVYLHGRTGETAGGGPVEESDALARLEREGEGVFDPDYVRLFIDKRCNIIEQRRSARMDYETPVDVTVLGPDGGEGRRFEAQALDLSEGGMLLRSAEPVEPGTAVHLAIRLPSGGMEAIARVARVLPDNGAGRRIGVYFLWYGPGKR
jgi:HD-GYP domain-containing protein (c-di-GMP phosphodiesterase class II)